MPKQEEVIAVDGLDKAAILSICYSSFIKLDWELAGAHDNILVGHTTKSWKAKSQQIIAAAADNVLTISSEMIHGESLDVLGKNKKNIALFVDAFNTLKSNINATESDNNKTAIETLQITTQQKIAQQLKDAAEVDAAMNLSESNLYVTYAIMGINVVVFILMIINGAGLMVPNGLVHIQWGSNFAPLTLSGDWWRLITCTFLHFGIIHIAMNMYCLYTVSVYLEPMLGKARFIAAYLCTGILSSLASLWWHSTPTNSAGASGAVFGMYGVFLALLTSNLIPSQVRKSLLQSIGIFIAYNLIYGMKGGIDNAAHVGGLLSGFVIGYIYIIGIKKEKQELEAKWILPVVALATAIVAFGYLSTHKSSLKQRNEILDEVSAAGFKDNEKFDTNIAEFVRLEEKAIAVKPVGNDNAAYKKELQLTAVPAWEAAAALAERMQGFTINGAKKSKAAILYNYATLRQQEANTIIEIIDTNNSDAETRLKQIAGKINSVMAQLK